MLRLTPKYLTFLSRFTLADKQLLAPSLISLHESTHHLRGVYPFIFPHLSYPHLNVSVEFLTSPFYPSFVPPSIREPLNSTHLRHLFQTLSHDTLAALPVSALDVPLILDLQKEYRVAPHLYILTGLSHALGNPLQFFETFSSFFSLRSISSLFYLPGPIHPAQMALFTYFGVDFFDNSYAILAASRNLRVTPSGLSNDWNVQTLHGSPSFSQLSEKIQWNTLVMLNELSIIREHIQARTLRDYVEHKSTLFPFLYSLLRHLDTSSFSTQFVNTSVPRKVTCISELSFHRPCVHFYRRRVYNTYFPRSPDAFLLLPCSAKKPYFTSKSHQKFYSIIRSVQREYSVDLRILIITSPLGVVPEELELTFPAAHYDIPVTGHWTTEEQLFVKQLLAAILQKAPESPVLSYLPQGYHTILDYFPHVVDIPFTGSATSSENLQKLKVALDDFLSSLNHSSMITRMSPELRRVAAITDYQFGKGCGDLLTQDAEIRGRYPRQQHLFIKNTPLASLRPDNGLLTLSLAGAEKIRPCTDHVVVVNSPLSGSSVFVSDIVSLPSFLHPGDEVVLVNSDNSLLGTGTLLVPPSMISSSVYGVAVSVRRKRS